MRVISVAAGSGYTLVASQAGELFSFGSAEWGALRHGNDDWLVLPTRVTALSPARGEVVKDVAAGIFHAMALTTQGQVFTWEDDEPPRAVEALHGIRVAQISAGNMHKAALSDAGELFTWGNDDGSSCLGHGDSGLHRGEVREEPARVEALAGIKVTSMSAGNYMTLAVAQDGAVYAFGRTEGGRLGMPAPQ